MKIKNLVRLLLALVAISAVTSLSGAWSAGQDPQKPVKIDKPGKGQGQKSGAQKIAQKGGGRAAKEAAIRKVLPTLKTSMCEAIGLAEKETGGKAFSAGLGVVEEKAMFQVNLFVGEKLTTTTIDPETKKVVVEGKAPEKGKPGDEGEGDDEDHGEDE